LSFPTLLFVIEILLFVIEILLFVIPILLFVIPEGNLLLALEPATKSGCPIRRSLTATGGIEDLQRPVSRNSHPSSILKKK